MNRTLLLHTTLLTAVVACGDDDATSPFVFTNAQFAVTPTFSDVRDFGFRIVVAGPLTPGTPYIDPALVLVDYRVIGFLAPGTPSAFPGGGFDLMRTIDGPAFYDQGSSLRFTIATGADLDDGLQVDELVGTSTVFTFDGREVGSGRFHPSLLELRANGTGRLQNSNNVPTLDPRLEVEPGAEYVTDLSFDPARITVIEIDD